MVSTSHLLSYRKSQGIAFIIYINILSAYLSPQIFSNVSRQPICIDESFVENSFSIQSAFKHIHEIDISVIPLPVDIASIIIAHYELLDTDGIILIQSLNIFECPVMGIGIIIGHLLIERNI